METKQLLLKLYAYNEWANTRIFDAAEQVIGADGTTAADEVRSLRALLFHLVRTEWFWRNEIQHKARPTTMPQPEDYPDLAALRAFAQAEARLGQQLVEQLSEQEIDSTIHLLDRHGQPTTLVVWHGLLQVLLHGVHHRSEAGLLLANLGHSPGDLDFILFA
jgi:uncharacterized damage-inducible protein DinB